MNEKFEFGFIGAGKLAGSVIRGFFLKGVCTPDRLVISEPNVETAAALQQQFGVSLAADNQQLAQRSETIFLGVKPQLIVPLLRELGPRLEKKLVVSLAAGIRIQTMESVAPARIMRVLTNTPSAIGHAATAFAPGSRATAADHDYIAGIFRKIGITIEVNDDQIDAVTALAGSGPAFVYAVIEALADGAVKSGLTHDAALKLAAQTASGAAALVLTSGKTPEELINMVVTPGGTTAAGLDVMQQRSCAAAISDAVEAAAERGRQMATQFENRT